MKSFKIAFGVLAVSFFCINNASALEIMNRANADSTIQRHTTASSQHISENVVPQNNTSNAVSSIAKQEILEPKMASIENYSNKGVQSNTVYVLKKIKKDKLGGSVHQNREIKNYLGIHY